jgi:hypothetical protein
MAQSAIDKNGDLVLVLYTAKNGPNGFDNTNSVIAKPSKIKVTPPADASEILLSTNQFEKTEDPPPNNNIIDVLGSHIYTTTTPADDPWRYIWLVPTFKKLTVSGVERTYVFYTIEHDKDEPKSVFATTIAKALEKPSPPYQYYE